MLAARCWRRGVDGAGGLTSPSTEREASTLGRVRQKCDTGHVASSHSVLVVDDQAPFRLAAKAVLRRLAGFELAGEASSGYEAIELVDQLHPELVLMDINMPQMNGIEGLHQARSSRRIRAPS